MRSMNALWLVIATSFRINPRLSLLSLSLPAGRALGSLNPLFYGVFVIGAVQHDSQRLVGAVVGLVACAALSEALSMIGTSARIKQQEELGFFFSHQVALTMGSIETLDHLESPELLDKLQMFRDYSGGLTQTIMALFNLLNVLASASATLAVALTADWRLVLLVILGTSRLVLTPWTLRWDSAVEEQGSPHSRRADTLVDLILDVPAAAEARVFSLQEELRSIIRAAVWRWQLPTIRYSRNYTVLESVNGLIYFGSAIAIVGWMLHDAINGTVSVQSLTIAITAIGSLQRVSGNVIASVKSTSQSLRSAKRYLWLTEYAAGVRDRYAGIRQPPPSLRTGIHLSGVSYRYHGATANSLTDVTLDLPAGSVVAIVGENGAGKSTLVKLLTGMYAPSSGLIRVDDVALADIDLTAWRQRCSGAFQDHVNLEYTAGDVIGVGDLRHREDIAEIHRALHEGAADDVLASLPHGLHTQLGTSWPEGVDLSGGQWQRLAIARGMMRRTPLLLVLDEPTSALDAATEHALFDRYASAARAARHRSAVTILVTHRFSTVAAADIVVVLHDGRIAEIGTHADLMSCGGRYADLYDMQARGYR